MITTYLTALVEMLNNEPPVTISELHNSLKPIKVMGYSYQFECRASSEVDFTITNILFKGKGKMYMVDTYNELYYFKQVW